MSANKNIRSHDNGDDAAMDRLRDRTDELELIISSLTIFALLSMPGWLWSQISKGIQGNKRGQSRINSGRIRVRSCMDK